MEKRLVNIDVISSCVCRDSFEIGKRSLMSHQYKITLFHQAVSPFSLYTPSDGPLMSINEEDLLYGSPWQRRLIITELRKNLFEKLGEEKRDKYLVLDFTDFARNLYRLKSNSDWLLMQTEFLDKSKEVFEQYVNGTIEPWSLPSDVINSRLDSFVDDILKRYDARRVILCKVYYCDTYISKEGPIKKFITPTGKFNEFTDYCYEYFIEAVKKRGQHIHIIDSPEKLLCNERHKWGRSLRHFCDEYYQYLLASIDCCICGYDEETELETLSCLKEECERSFEKYYLIDKLEMENRQLKAELMKAKKNEEAARLIIKQNDLVALKQEINNIKKSKSYKIGRIITYIPRKLLRRK